MGNEIIIVPAEIPGDEIVLVTAIYKDSGSHVGVGDPIAEIETSKTAYQIEAQISGIIHHELNIGDEVQSGDTLGEIVENK